MSAINPGQCWKCARGFTGTAKEMQAQVKGAEPRPYETFLSAYLARQEKDPGRQGFPGVGFNSAKPKNRFSIRNARMIQSPVPPDVTACQQAVPRPRCEREAHQLVAELV